MQGKSTLLGVLCALGATLIWSGNFIVARDLAGLVPPVTLAFWRWVLAVLVFLPFAWSACLRDWHFLRQNFVYLSMAALLGVTVFNTLIYLAGYSTTAVNLSLIAITFPVFIIVLARFFFLELITKNKLAGITLVILGVLLLISKGNVQQLGAIKFAIGDLWMLLAAVAFALYSILVKKRPEGISSRSFQFSTFLLGLVFLSPFYVWEASLSNFKIHTIGAKEVISIGYIGVFSSLVAFILWGKAIEILGPAKTSMIYYTLPLFSGALAYALLGEQIGGLHLVTLMLIVTGVVIAVYEPRRIKVD